MLGVRTTTPNFVTYGVGELGRTPIDICINSNDCKFLEYTYFKREET